MSEELELPLKNRSTGRTTSVRFFRDDIIEVVRIKIGIALGIHHDRLRIYADAELPGSYYADDPRAWKSLFLRMSPDGKPLRDISMKSYIDSRDSSFPFPNAGVIDEPLWMTDVPREFEASFHELRILGVPEHHSWIFPLDNKTDPVVLPQPADIARPENKTLFKSIHPLPIRGFVVIPFDDTEAMRPQLKDQYVPYLKPGTPGSVSDSLQISVKAQTTLIRTLTDLSVQKPKKKTILRARWRIPLVDTNFGESSRNRFEQIFFGLTLSKDTPYVGFFTSRREQSRHKFYSEDTVNKKPILDLKVWARWWTVSKPSRNRPTLLVYRGEDRSHFDRIAVTTTDIIISSQRPEEASADLDEMKESIAKWMNSLDALNPFLVEKDLDRWEIQNVSAHFEYEKLIEEADFRRFDCIRTVFEIADKKSLSFRFLRSDATDVGLSTNEAAVLSIIRDEPSTSIDEIAEDLKVPRSEAERLLTSVRSKLEDDPTIEKRAIASLPSFKFSSKSVLVLSANDIDRTESYISILRHVLTNPNDSSLDAVCPKRVEVVEAVAAVPEAFQAAPDDDGLGDLLGDLMNDVGEMNAGIVVAAPVVALPQKKTKANVKVSGEKETLYSYFNIRMQEFDPETFVQGAKTCDLKRQPVVMSAAELERDSEYNPLETYEGAKILETTNPDGIFLCPEYWCVTDNIPLKEEQLENGKCPVCRGKVRPPKSDAKVSEYPVLKRSEEYAFPGHLKQIAANGKSIPCCFKNPQKTRVSKLIKLPPSRIELFYILGESKMELPSLRLAYLHPKTLQSLTINSANYQLIKRDDNRIQAGRAGIFRVGVGRPSETLHKTLGVPQAPKPKDNAHAVIRCSFFRSWGKLSQTIDEKLFLQFPQNPVIPQMVQGIHEAYESHQLSVLNELEYLCITYDCDFYRVLVEPDGSTSVGCMFSSGFLRNMKRSIAVLFHTDSPQTIDYIGFVSRTSSASDPQVITNLFNPVFEDTVRGTLNAYRERACWLTPLPTMKHALTFLSKSGTPYLVLDPYGRSQAFIYPGKAIIPFQPESVPDVTGFIGVFGFSSISEDMLPKKDFQVELLKKFTEYHGGYEYKEDLVDSDGVVREILLASGLRIPIQPIVTDKVLKAKEVVETIRKHNETTLVFGRTNREDTTVARNIRYETEVFEFLLFQMAKDLVDYPDLKEALLQQEKDSIVEEVGAWFDSAVIFHELEDPTTFVSKIRTPCSSKGKADCTGMCAWSENICKIDVKKFNRSQVEKRILSALLSNDKIRSIVLEGRASPFFSTVLYLEMPHELFLSDTDLAEYKNIARSE